MTVNVAVVIYKKILYGGKILVRKWVITGPDMKEADHVLGTLTRGFRIISCLCVTLGCRIKFNTEGRS